jgi:AcrR family transcriptional regulator
MGRFLPDCPRRRRKIERPSEILEAAFETFIANGFEATRLDDVAARAGITKGTIYLYFDSKETLFLACLAESMRPALEHLGSLTTDLEGPAFDLLRRHLDFAGAMLVDNRQCREVMRLVIAEGGRFPEIVERWRRDFVDPMQRALMTIGAYGVERGEFQPMAVATFAHIVFAPIVFANNWLMVFGDDPTFDVKTFFKGMLDMYAAGLLKRA